MILLQLEHLLAIGLYVEKSKEEVIVKLYLMEMDLMKFLDLICILRKLHQIKILKSNLPDYWLIFITMMS